LQYRRLFGESGELNVYAQSRKTDSTAKTSVTGNISDNKATENNIQLLYKHSFEFAKTAITGGLDNMTTDSQTWGYVNNSSGSFDFFRGALVSNSVSKERHRSPFLQYEFSPLDPLRLTIGARNDNIEYTVDDQINNLKDGNKSFSRLVKKAGATFNFDDENLIWVNIAEGFLAPAVGTMLGSNTATPATHAAAVSSSYVPTNMNLLPEDSLTKEIGIRGRLDSGLSYDTDYYQTQFRNLIVSQNCGLTELCKTRNENAASAHASGFESVFGYELNKYFDLGLSHTYARYQYDSYVTASANYTGKQRYWTPRNHYNFRITAKPAADWKAELELDHIDGYYTNQSNTDTYKRPDIYNLRVSYNGKSWGFWGHALNLFNTKYMERLGATDAGVRNSITSGYSPLTLRAGVSYKF
jgi:iron complex outermembrane receptor protein